MPERWFVRVEGREYGPVDLEELREWRLEGRLIPTNEVRAEGEAEWHPARSLAEIFEEQEATPVVTEAPATETATHARSWSQIVRETSWVYGRGLPRFLFFALLSSVPMFALQWSLPRFQLPAVNPDGSLQAMEWTGFSSVSLVLLLLVLILWPVSIGGFQFVANDLVCGRTSTLGRQLRAALARWRQILATGLLVYIAYFFWFAIPFSVLIGLAGNLTLLNALLFFFISGFMVYMSARLFINFLFWQPAAALRPHGALSALRESKELARCAPQSPRLERPLYRGIIVASVWLLVVLVLTFGVQIPFAIARFVGVQSTAEAMALAQNLSETKTPDTLMILADVASSLVNLFLQPLLAAAFVVLYYDARARAGRRESDDDPL